MERVGATVLVVAASAAVISVGGVARAAPPVFVDPPARVYTSPGVNLSFAGDDAITEQSKKIDVTFNGPTDGTCDVIDEDEHSGNCAFAQIRILEAGRGAMTIDDSGIAYTSATQSGDNTFNIAGKFADIKGALESLVYVPPDDEFETTDDTPVTLEVSVQAPQPDPDSAAVQVDIRVEGPNDPPNLTAPGDDPYEVNVNDTFSVSEAAGTEVFTVTDEDAQQDDNLPPDYLLGVAWLDCGTMTFVKPNQSPGLVAYEGPIEDMFAQLAADYQAIAADPSIVVGEIGQNLTLGTGWADVVAVGWIASIDADNDDFTDNFNEVISWIDFHAPAAPATCTLTVLVSDLGNNGMPLLGEVPNFGFDVDSVVFNVVDPNAPPDTPVDTPPDTPVDTPPDTPVDTPPGTPPDTPVDTPPDTPVDTPPDDPTGGTRRTPALQAVVTVQCGAVDGMFQAQFQVTNPTPYRFEGGLESLDPGASFSYGIGFPEPSGQFGVNGYFDVDADGSQGPGDVPYAATWPAVAPANCDTTTTEPEPPGDLPTPPNPSLVVTVQTECVDDGASYLATFASSNPSPYTFYGLWVIPPGGTAYNVQGFVAPFTVTVTGYFDLDGSGSMTPPEFNTSQTVAVDPPADCDTTTTDPGGTTEPGDTSEPAPSDPTTTSTSTTTTTTTTIPPCSEVAELVVQQAPPTVAPTAPSTAPPTQPPTVPPTDPTTTASTTSTTQAPRRTTTTTTAAGGPGPGLPIRTTTTLRIVVPPRITVPRPPGGMRSIDGGGVRASIGRPQPAVGACVDTSGTMLPATGSSMMPELVAVGSLLVLSGGALLAIRRRATP